MRERITNPSLLTERKYIVMNYGFWHWTGHYPLQIPNLTLAEIPERLAGNAAAT